MLFFYKHRVRLRMAASVVSVVALALWPFLVANRGIDPSDTAYLLNDYMKTSADFSSAPVTRAVSSWLSALLLLPFSSHQWLAIRMAGAALCAGTLLLAFFSLIRIFPLRCVLPFSAVAVILYGQFPAVIGYNSLSYFFFAAAISFLLRGFRKDRFVWFLFAGVVIGVNAFVRLPNVLQIALAGAVLWRYWACEKEWKKALARAAWFLLGAAAAAAAVFGACLLVIGPDNVLSSLFRTASRALAAADGEIMTYSLAGALQNFFLVLGQISGALLTVVPCAVLLGQGSLLFQSYRCAGRVWAPVFSAVLLLAALALGWWVAFPLAVPSSYPTLLWSALAGGFCILGCGAALFYYRRRSPPHSAVAALALIVLLTMPFGTNTLFIAYTNYWHFTLPATAGLLFCMWRDVSGWWWRTSGKLQKKPAPAMNLLPAALLGVCLVQCAVPSALHPYLDGPYAELTVQTQNLTVLEGMYTTQVNADMIENYAEKLKRCRELPLVNVGAFTLGTTVTGMKPFFGISNPIPSTLTSKKMEDALAAGKEDGVMPVITFTDITHNRFYYDENNEKTKVLLDYIAENQYISYYADDSHLIFLPRNAFTGT